MLKALELLGFKSFADKTRFEFPPGITVVVGPNGSGKSNIVDAIKWVLGEQSAKSLRGQEMADVIFKGSGSGSRRPANTAEATIFFDNVEGRLSIDAPEVQVTRRVYRSGEGEYLINRQPCRLKDVKDLFRGTGVGADAYSLIEQGKVDTLLQASPRDRRAIFEEAAGISRFKIKRVEAQRRLERVEQNLLRLSDIVDEVDGRLRSIRAQASKARRYREYTDRLQQLRTEVALADQRAITEKLQAVEARLNQSRGEAAECVSQGEALEAAADQLETRIAEAVEEIRAAEASMAANRERIAGCESSSSHERRRLVDLDEEVARYRIQLTALNTRAEDVQARLRETEHGFQCAEREFHQAQSRQAEHERSLRELLVQLRQVRDASEGRRRDHTERIGVGAALGQQIEAGQSQLAAAAATVDRSQERVQRLRQSLEEAGSELTEFSLQEKQLQEQVAQADTTLQQHRRELADGQRRLESSQDELMQERARHAGLRERVDVLDDLERRQEGVSEGAKEVLARSRDATDGAFAEVRGLVADLLQVDVDMAPLVDVALGERAQLVVLQGPQMLQQLASEAYRPAGRVGFLPLAPEPHPTSDDSSLRDKPRVIGRADRFVEAARGCEPLVERLLADTWFVETLADAMSLHREASQPMRFVTRCGELVEADGVVVVGPRLSTSGLISRRSQLKTLRGEMIELESRIENLEGTVVNLRRRHADQEGVLRELETSHTDASRALAEERVRVQAAQDRRDQLRQQVESVTAELLAAQQLQETTQGDLALFRGQLAEAETAINRLVAAIEEDDQQIHQLEQQRHHLVRETTASKVELAKSEQRLETLRAQVMRFQEDRQERNRAVEDARSHLAQCLNRRSQAQRSILSATSELAEFYLHQESLFAETASAAQARAEWQQERAEVGRQQRDVRSQLHQLEESQHKEELLAGELRHERNALSNRLRDDYGIELSELEGELADDHQHHRTEVDEEIADLRRKISNIGAVNMEALAELDELEERHRVLHGQYDDMTEGRKSLERIIDKINTDSRRIFTETLETVRTNFQTLFRKVFGGGRADIVLEEGLDILEGGIEIIANPPGKHALSISLLSGGERALTAVTLLLAIFQYRPSPFCVLDEVDGPLDEANIGRFIDVLTEFLDWTKFVIVTHSKKTMTAATTLYGVTMQESGVSKRVSVHFDDVSEGGHIRPEALNRDDSPEPGDERGAA